MSRIIPVLTMSEVVMDEDIKRMLATSYGDSADLWDEDTYHRYAASILNELQALHGDWDREDYKVHRNGARYLKNISDQGWYWDGAMPITRINDE